MKNSHDELFKKITVCLDMVGCPNRCKHCWIGHFPNGKLGVKELVEVASSFKPYTSALEVYSWFREPDYANNYKELWELDNELSVNTSPQRFELLSFYRIVRDPLYVLWAYEQGVRRCQLTFFGLEEITDHYVGRQGAFKELLKATEILIENQIAPRWQLFVNQDNLGEIEALVQLSKDLKLDERCRVFGEEFELFMHNGSCDGANELLYEIRVCEEDLEQIPEVFRGGFGLPEAHWYAKLCESSETRDLKAAEPVFYVTKDLDVYPNFTAIHPWWKLGNLAEDGVDAILKGYWNNESLGQKISSTVPIGELVRKCGQASSKKLFEKEDYVMYMLNCYCRLAYDQGEV